MKTKTLTNGQNCIVYGISRAPLGEMKLDKIGIPRKIRILSKYFFFPIWPQGFPKTDERLRKINTLFHSFFLQKRQGLKCVCRRKHGFGRAKGRKVGKSKVGKVGPSCKPVQSLKRQEYPYQVF